MIVLYMNQEVVHQFQTLIQLKRLSRLWCPAQIVKQLVSMYLYITLERLRKMIVLYMLQEVVHQFQTLM